MSKEIIIGGVNVAGCVQLVEEPFYHCGLGGECKGWENCYYKQLKRLEQENTELKAENERLKKELKNNKAVYEVELGTYNMECGNLLEENKQLLQTLQEIKAIAEADVHIVGDEKLYYDSIEKILQVIKAEEE